MTRLFRSLPIFVALLLFAAAPVCAASPDESIRQLQKGVDEADSALVDKYIDIDKVINHTLDVVLKNEDIVRMASEYPPLAIVISLGGGPSGTMVRQFLAQETKQFVGFGVSSGAFAGRPKPGMSKLGGLMGALLRGGANDRKLFGNATTKGQTGSTARVITSLFDASNGENYPLELGMEKQNGVWRIVEIANTAKLIDRLVGKPQ